jgi:small basic protein (TIGR04137 family)
MSMDRSLKSKSTLARHRNVLSRAERIVKLQDVGQWSETSRPFGLPKVAHRKLAVGKKAKTEKKAEGEGAAAAAPAVEKKEAATKTAPKKEAPKK